MIPLILGSCNTKKETIDNVENKTDSELLFPGVPTDQKVASNKKAMDSVINNSKATKKVLNEGVMRKQEGNEIVREADASLLAFTIGEEFTKDNQRFILKIKNVNKPKLTVTVQSKETGMNIRVNQIKKPDGSMDGPFDKSVTYDTPQKGDYWIFIGHNQMTDGKRTGTFTVNVK